MSKVKRTRSQNAFTLIELLVVIAIIAILAAILFPVFAQAKEAAKKITCLSHVKELNAAFIMYANDYDDTWMSTGKQNFTVTSQAELNQFGGNKYDIFYLAQPYVKNYDIFFCPDRHVITTSTVDGFGGNSNRADNELFGYGMNYGPMHNRAGFGLVHASTKYMPSSPYYNKAHFFQGRSFSEFVNPAGLTTIQDTGDSPQYTNSPYDMCQLGSTAAACTAEEFRHNGFWSYGFVDGHAHGIQQGTYSVANDGDGFTIMPVKLQDIVNNCYDPQATTELSSTEITRVDGSGVYESAHNCQDTAAELVRDRVALPH